MIPANAITAWGVDRRWPTREQVEQDLLLSRSLCAIAADPYLGAELVFRGGTALHKLHLKRAYRYSEDLDYVRRSATGIGELTTALTRLGGDLGFTVSTRVGIHPKVYWRTAADSGVQLRIKIEINTHERSPALPLIMKDHRVESSWWSGSWASRRSAGGTRRHQDPRALPAVEGARPVRPLAGAGRTWSRPGRHYRRVRALPAGRADGWTGPGKLAQKMADRTFRHDLDPLVADRPDRYTIDGRGRPGRHATARPAR